MAQRRESVVGLPVNERVVRGQKIKCKMQILTVVEQRHQQFLSIEKKKEIKESKEEQMMAATFDSTRFSFRRMGFRLSVGVKSTQFWPFRVVGAAIGHRMQMMTTARVATAVVVGTRFLRRQGSRDTNVKRSRRATG